MTYQLRMKWTWVHNHEKGIKSNEGDKVDIFFINKEYNAEYLNKILIYLSFSMNEQNWKQFVYHAGYDGYIGLSI